VTGDEQLRSGLVAIGVVLCVAAAVVLVEILTGDRVGNDTAGKALETALAVGFVSLSVGAGSQLIARQPRIAAFGYLTILTAAVALLLTTILFWHEGNFLFEVGALERWSWYTLVGTTALGVGSLLLAGHDDRDADSVKLVRGMTVFTVLALLVTVIDELRTSGDPVDPYLLGSLSVFFVLGCLLVPLLSRITAEERPVAGGLLEGLDHVVIAVSDRARSDRFYAGVLGAEIETDAAGRTAYRIGTQRLNVHETGQERAPLAADPVRPGNSDLCFAWPGSAEQAASHLRARGVTIVEGPVPREGTRGAGISVYCRDPDGTLIELISYS
jgi:catechol 2,3-dioxygenase-like lactoylglutathione lyase family enzyme